MLLSFFLYSLVAPINASALNIQCAFGNYKNYSTAQEQWQRGLTDLIVKTNGNLKDVASMYLADQLNYIEMNLIAIEFTLRHNPSKIRTDAPINQWLDLDSDNKLAIAKISNRYAELLNLANAAKRRPSHPDGEALRMLMRNRIVKTTEYQNLLSEFNRVVANMNSNACGA